MSQRQNLDKTAPAKYSSTLTNVKLPTTNLLFLRPSFVITKSVLSYSFKLHDQEYDHDADELRVL